MTFEPLCHLGVLIFVVCRTICVLCEVDVESLGGLGVVVVCCSKKFDEADIVEEEVEFGYIEA